MPDEWVALRNAAKGCFCCCCCCCNGMLEYLWSHETISTIYYINILTNARNSRAQPKLKSVYSTQCLCMCQNGKRPPPPSSVSFGSLSLLLSVCPWERECAFSFPKDTSHTPIPEKYIAVSFRHSISFSPSLFRPSQQNANSILHWLFRSAAIIHWKSQLHFTKSTERSHRLSHAFMQYVTRLLSHTFVKYLLEQ